MERKTQTGYLMLANISGDTSFVGQTKIEHANIYLRTAHTCTYGLECQSSI